MGPGDLATVLKPLKGFWHDYQDDNLLVGLDVADDAAVYKVSHEQAIIQTVDFFTPIVDDPYAYGAIAAANSMSDVYAMGGEVMLALNIGAFPNDLPHEMVSAILMGAAEKVREAGAIVAGGHTVMDQEPKFGLVITGTIHPNQILTLAGAQPSDLLILTKPLGSGIIATAARADGLVDKDHLDEAITTMTTLNRKAAAALRQVGAHACTDITGFGLLGHASEMAEASGVGMQINALALPMLSGTLDYIAKRYVTGGANRNKNHFQNVVIDSAVESAYLDLAWDPQTSGGLLIAVSESQASPLLAALEHEGCPAWVIGHVTKGSEVVLVP